ncbi:MAG: hypothetical protein CL596_10200 [Alteromonas sp.]|nr:hypothetical protein [Alteromonas sp.]
MKTINLLVCFLVLMLEIPDMSSQTYTDENAELSNRELVISNNGNAAIFQALGINNNQSNNRNANISGNSLSLRQIGDYNQVRVNSSATASEINVTQNGDYNLTNLEYKVNTVVADLTQNGDNNLIKDYVYDSSEDIYLNLQQDGDNLTFDKFGSNELTKSLQFRQTEASPKIIIRSFQ